MASHQLALLSNPGLHVVLHIVVLCYAEEHLLFLLKLWDHFISYFALDICNNVGRNFSISTERPSNDLWIAKCCLQGKLASCSNAANEELVRPTVHSCDFLRHHLLNSLASL